MTGVCGIQSPLEDTLRTPTIRKLWYGTKVDATCKVCNNNKHCSVPHVLSGCNPALHQDRYKWGYVSILLQIFKVVREARNRGHAKLKLKQQKAQTKECSKQVMVNGDIFHQLASEIETSDVLETIPEEQTPRVSHGTSKT